MDLECDTELKFCLLETLENDSGFPNHGNIMEF